MCSETSAIHIFRIAIIFAIHVFLDIRNPYLLYCNSPCNTCFLGHLQSMYFGTSAIHIYCIAIYHAIHVFWDIRNPCILGHLQSLSLVLQFTLQYMYSGTSAIYLAIHVFWDIRNPYLLFCNLLCNTCILRYLQSISFELQFASKYMYYGTSSIYIFCIAIYFAILVF